MYLLSLYYSFYAVFKEIKANFFLRLYIDDYVNYLIFYKNEFS